MSSKALSRCLPFLAALSLLASPTLRAEDRREPLPSEIAADIAQMDPSQIEYSSDLEPSALESTESGTHGLDSQLLILVHKTVAEGEKQFIEIFKNADAAPFFTALTSTGKPGHSTPGGKYSVMKLVKDYVSHTYNSPMPWSVFFKDGYAVHGTMPEYYPDLGRPASHGCVRLHQKNAEYVYNTVKDIGPRNTTVVIH